MNFIINSAVFVFLILNLSFFKGITLVYSSKQDSMQNTLISLVNYVSCKQELNLFTIENILFTLVY